METIDIILWVLTGGFGLMLVMWNNLNKKFESTDSRIDKLSDKVEDIDRRLCRIEGSLATSGHCLFNQSKCEQKIE